VVARIAASAGTTKTCRWLGNTRGSVIDGSQWTSQALLSRSILGPRKPMTGSPAQVFGNRLAVTTKKQRTNVSISSSRGGLCVPEIDSQERDIVGLALADGIFGPIGKRIEQSIRESAHGQITF